MLFFFVQNGLKKNYVYVVTLKKKHGKSTTNITNVLKSNWSIALPNLGAFGIVGVFQNIDFWNNLVFMLWHELFFFSFFVSSKCKSSEQIHVAGPLGCVLVTQKKNNKKQKQKKNDIKRAIKKKKEVTIQNISQNKKWQ